MYWCCCIDSQALDSTFAKDDTLLPITLRLATAIIQDINQVTLQRGTFVYWCCCIDSQALDSTFAKDDTLLPITLRLATASRKGVRSERGQRSSLKRGLFLYVKKRKSLLNLSALLYFF